MTQHGDEVRYEEHGDDDARKAWLLTLIDETPDKLAIVQIPRTETEEQLSALEERMIRAYDLAKKERPGLVVKLIPPLEGLLPPGRRPEDVTLLMVLHEHERVAGECVSCGHTA